MWLAMIVLHARSVLGERSGAHEARYMDDIGFVLIALFNGFVIVAALDLGAPAWAVVVGAVLAAVVGSRAKDEAKRRPGLAH